MAKRKKLNEKAVFSGFRSILTLGLLHFLRSGGGFGQWIEGVLKVSGETGKEITP